VKKRENANPLVENLQYGVDIFSDTRTIQGLKSALKVLSGVGTYKEQKLRPKPGLYARNEEYSPSRSGMDIHL
jgi:hypothetical protein